MSLLILIGMIAASGISVILTMREAKADTVRGALLLKVLAADALLWLPIAAAFVIADR